MDTIYLIPNNQDDIKAEFYDVYLSDGALYGELREDTMNPKGLLVFTRRHDQRIFTYEIGDRELLYGARDLFSRVFDGEEIVVNWGVSDMS